MLIILIVSFFILLFSGVPIAVALGLSSLFSLLTQHDIPLVLIIQRMFVAINSFPLLAVPLFILAGSLMGFGGISKRIVNFADALVGHITGGLANVTILTCMIFAGISGSAVADTAAVGKILAPSMIAKKYPAAYAAAVIGIASTIGIVIPPSIPMVILGSMLEISVGKMFLGGILPGIMIGIALMVVAYIVAKKEKVERNNGSISFKALLRSFKETFWALLMPVVIVGGIVGGFFTPTEAGAIAVAYALIVGFFVYRKLKIKHVWECLWDSGLTTAKVFYIIATASIFAWILTTTGFSNMLCVALLSISHSPIVIMILIVTILLIVTTFMESLASLILLMPILFPVTRQVGIDPVVFGVLVVISIGVGLVTPPVGLCLYVSSDIAKVTLAKAAKTLVPFLIVMIAILFFFIFCPQFITFIPNLIMR